MSRQNFNRPGRPKYISSQPITQSLYNPSLTPLPNSVYPNSLSELILILDQEMEEKSKLEVTLIGEADPDASASSSSSSSAEQVAAMLHESESESEKKIESDDSEMVKKTESASVSFLFSEPAIRFWFCRKLIRVWFCFAKQSESEKGDIVETEASKVKTAVLGPPGPKFSEPAIRASPRRSTSSRLRLKLMALRARSGLLCLVVLVPKSHRSQVKEVLKITSSAGKEAGDIAIGCSFYLSSLS
ncbi:uncharacterized protein LOC112195055 isoform X3 [Rosa chinensis]|uniref:uncharacterized protein LOC112195055 isoform X3 n=1 Tax=Rosa chinensis TaxID=74649 RepID=UPI001AD8BF7F|nr:uncharacterized protein LOC112195055 isoform X3 [Rosa chinensis]